jgi:hypothetical protein
MKSGIGIGIQKEWAILFAKIVHNKHTPHRLIITLKENAGEYFDRLHKSLKDLYIKDAKD